MQVVEEANRRIEGMTVYAMVDSEMLDRMKLAPSTHILSVEKGRNFEMVAQLLGRGSEMPRTTHADGAETSWTLHFYPEVVRPGYQRFPQSPSSALPRGAVAPAIGRRTRAAAVGSRSTRPRRPSASRSSITRPPASARPFCRCCERSDLARHPGSAPGAAALQGRARPTTACVSARVRRGSSSAFATRQIVTVTVGLGGLYLKRS